MDFRWYHAISIGTVFSIISVNAISGSCWAKNNGTGKEVAQANAVPTTDSDEPATGSHKSFSGNMSWYGPGLNGHRTASGELLDMYKLTAAHRKLPFFTKVLVEDPKSGQSCIVKVNDRGPFVRTRVMDVTKEAAKRLGTLGRGIFYGECLILDDRS